MEKKQGILFDDFEDLDWWRKEWQDMPEYEMEDLTSFQSVIVHFETEEDRDNFAKLMEQNITYLTKSIWFPKVKIAHFMNKRYIVEEK
tara:strand:+ start:1512 stop:1775 length:264 start_codon:yes stop_codon:yes gene_type:complete